MVELIEKLMGAAYPSKTLDGLIHKAVRADIPAERWREFGGIWCVRDEYYDEDGFDVHDTECYDGPPAYTSSIDAALTLVPEGLCWGLTYQNPEKPSAFVMDLDAPSRDEDWDAVGETPALALCIAALRAIQADRESRGSLVGEME